MIEWLAKILPDNISLNFSPKLNINVVKIVSQDSTTKKVPPVVIDGDKLLIDDTQVDQATIDQIITELPKQLRHNDLVIEEENLESFEQIVEEIEGSDYESDLAKFKPVVPKRDLPIIEVATLIRIKFSKGENISSLKNQVVQRYGSRAGMICNLYTSGYFESLVYPLYQTVQQGEMAMDEYLDVYEMIVTESPLAMFVGIGATLAKVKSHLLEKIRSNKENDVSYLNIHGIGESNIKLIESLLQDKDVASIMTEEPTICTINKSIKATIYV